MTTDTPFNGVLVIVPALELLQIINSLKSPCIKAMMYDDMLRDRWRGMKPTAVLLQNFYETRMWSTPERKEDLNKKVNELRARGLDIIYV